jgi:hypothetical protein
MHCLDCRLKLRLSGFGHADISLPAFVLQGYGLDSYCVAVGVQFRQGLVFRHPTPVDVVSNDFLPGFVIQFYGDILTEVFKGDLLAHGIGVGVVPDLLGP